MKEASKPSQCPASIAADLKGIFSMVRPSRRRSKLFLYGFAFAFVACTAYLAFFSQPAGSASSLPWFNNLFSSASASTAPYRSQISSLFSSIFPNSSSPAPVKATPLPGKATPLPENFAPAARNQTEMGVAVNNSTGKSVGGLKGGNAAAKNQTRTGLTKIVQEDGGRDSTKDDIFKSKNQTGSGITEKYDATLAKHQSGVTGARLSNSSSTSKTNESMITSAASTAASAQAMKNWINRMKTCDIFQGNWVTDDLYPLYPEGSCPHIDEPFNCYLNGRPDLAYQKLRWQPDGCQIPRLNATDMLKRLRGKRLVFVGDSLNRNMWESLVCILRNSVSNKKKVFEASGRHEFKTEGSYSFVFEDYNCSVEFFRSPFLVQEWEMPISNGTAKETLRLDIIERSSPRYKDADVLIFNTGHWWTHEKTSKGKDYYQEGNHVYNELKVIDAFHKALNTWAKWVDNNVNPKKTLVLFRGYSASHFSGGQWNSGGQCDRETEPIKNKKYLSRYPPKMDVLESVIRNMKTPVSYLNITRMTDYRKDAHPSIYRKQNLTEEERKAPERYQDCSHWCLPGVPDSWNELLYAKLLIKQHEESVNF